jgi:hypothetical protein
MEQQSCEMVSPKDHTNGGGAAGSGLDSLTKENPSALMQVRLCLPLNRTNPVAVLLSTTSLSVSAINNN